MNWNDLSNEAKSIIEWVENPFTNEKETIKIKIEKVFHRECPTYYINNIKQPDINILITEELYQEILKFVIEDDKIQYEQSIDGLIFRLN